jgi:drug/metabolite transporter (DMT)-like permease
MLLGGNGLLTLGEVTLPAGIAALLVATVPIWLIVIDSLFVTRRIPGPAIWIGVGVGLAGVVLLVKPNRIQQIDLRAAFGVLLASFLWAAGSLCSRYGPHPSSPFLASSQQMLVGGVACLAVGLAIGEANGLHLTVSATLAILWLAGPGSIIGFSAYIYALKVLPTSVVSTYAFANPLIAVALGVLLLGEQLTSQTLISMIAILVSIGMILWSAHRHTSPTPANVAHTKSEST